METTHGTSHQVPQPRGRSESRFWFYTTFSMNLRSRSRIKLTGCERNRGLYNTQSIARTVQHIDDVFLESSVKPRSPNKMMVHDTVVQRLNSTLTASLLFDFHFCAVIGIMKPLVEWMAVHPGQCESGSQLSIRRWKSRLEQIGNDQCWAMLFSFE
jgi:hypothetical protein